MAVPLSADRLLQALRAEGVRVVEVGNWRTHNRNHKGAWGPVNGSLVHHTVTRGTDSTVRIVRDGYADLPGPLCHGMIAKDGWVHLVGWGRTNHAGGGDPRVLDQVIAESYSGRPTPPTKGNSNGVDGNAHFYGWECENLGDGKDSWPKAQYDAIVRVQAALCRAHGWSAKSVIGHREWSADKIDPRGIDMPLLRADVAERLKHPADWNHGSDPNEEDPMPDYVNLGLAKPYTLKPNVWDSIEFTQEWSDTADGHAAGGAVFVRGAARFTGSISLRLDGLPVGDVVQARMSEYEGDVHKADHPIHEIVGTPGGAFGVVALTKRLGKGRGMRVRLLNQSEQPINVSSAVLTALVWMES
ncbi:N-acetylmuramoyl-L-alanine amidase [Streptomyces sp. NPDC057557]|uniref:peptidoglycan recognition protein family protein n=1 Tax=Streptomyces sp. NPDC057557 TaxID=3346167 RepID=UPI0036BA9613